jgi:acetoin utilization deacetylase AcuC-like enzyme
MAMVKKKTQFLLQLLSIPLIGTQSIFYDTNEVMYISVHRHDNGTFYPFSGKIEEHGVGVGEGFNVNIPFQSKSCQKFFKMPFEYIYTR